MYNEASLRQRAAEAIIKFRERFSLTQEQAARQLEVSQQTISRVESAADNVSLRVVLRVIEAATLDAEVM